jgi:hypothetical protein
VVIDGLVVHIDYGIYTTAAQCTETEGLAPFVDSQRTAGNTLQLAQNDPPRKAFAEPVSAK